MRQAMWVPTGCPAGSINLPEKTSWKEGPGPRAGLACEPVLSECQEAQGGRGVILVLWIEGLLPLLSQYTASGGTEVAA